MNSGKLETKIYRHDVLFKTSTQPTPFAHGLRNCKLRNKECQNPFWKSESCALIRIMTIIKSKNKCTCAR